MNAEEKERLEEIYYCFRYRCKRCPKARECEEKEKKDEKCRKNQEKELNLKESVE